jgi:hypothetical protein
MTERANLIITTKDSGYTNHEGVRCYMLKPYMRIMETVGHKMWWIEKWESVKARR